MSAASAQTDRFVHERLPAPADWPYLHYDLPPLRIAAQVNLVAAIAFYLVYGVGLLVFVVVPDGATGSWRRTLCRGALFGFVAYAVYDLTNLATLRDWPLAVALVDMAWGSLASLSAAAAGKAGFDRLSGAIPGARAD